MTAEVAVDRGGWGEGKRVDQSAEVGTGVPHSGHLPLVLPVSE
jgi:hypothetical protein